MHGQTQEQHNKMRDEIKRLCWILRANNDNNDEIIQFMENAALNVAGGIKEVAQCGPEAIVTGDPKDVLGTSEFHESYGQVGFSRITCHPAANLYGSNIRHGELINLTIRRSRKYRNLNSDRYHGGDAIVSVLLSPAQFAELLTSLNVGLGVPCTIQNIFYNHMASSPEESQRQKNETEFKETCEEAMQESQSVIADVAKLFNKKKNIGKDDRNKIIKQLERLQRLLTDRIPFMQKQYAEAMEKTEVEAKAAVEAFVTYALTSIGAEALRNKLVQLPEPQNSKALPQ